jgi:hypothetical protein
MRISLHKRDRRFSGESAKYGSVVASQQTLPQNSPGVIDPVYYSKALNASYVNDEHDTFRYSPTVPNGKRQGLRAPPTLKSTQFTAI